MDSEPELKCSLKESDTPQPFTESGNCDDEITLLFDDHKKLFASKNFLRYASPVFEAMFNHDFKEKKQNCVELTRKKYEDFLEFLLCLHPRIQESITETNVLRIATVAEEYQVTSIISKCKELMESMLSESVKHAESKHQYMYHAEPLRRCIRVVAKAAELNYDGVVSSGVKTVAKFGHILYNQGQKTFVIRNNPFFSIKIKDETLGQIQEDCMRLFNELPVDVRYKILSERLLFWDDVDLK